MKTLVKLNANKESVFFIFILIFATVFYLFNITFSDLWFDESYTAALVRHSFSDMLGLIKNDFHPPLYFYVLKVFTFFIGVSPFTIRLFSVIGVLSALVLGYITGQRVFGKRGALYFCLLLVALPMLESYSHFARMYTWAAFSITGVFLYAYLFMTTNKIRDLALLSLFSIMSAYIHNFSLIGAFWANVFVFIYLLFKRNKAWRTHFIAVMIMILIYLPWTYILIMHLHKVEQNYWIPNVSWHVIFSCYTQPFAQNFVSIWTSFIMIFIVFILTTFTIIRSFVKHENNQWLILTLSLVIFNFTVISTAVISLLSQPILYPRYIMTVVTMIMVPPTLFIMNISNKWPRVTLLGILICCGIYTSFKSSFFSFGSYKQSMEFLAAKQPDVKKVVHIQEITTGPLLEHNEVAHLTHYWFQTDKTQVYSNMDVFSDLHQVRTLDEFLKKGEVFSAVSFLGLPFNGEVLDRILAQSELLRSDTIWDNKEGSGVQILLYKLRYRGGQ